MIEMKMLDILNKLESFDYSDEIMGASPLGKNIVVNVLISGKYLEKVKEGKLTGVLILMDREEVKNLK